MLRDEPQIHERSGPLRIVFAPLSTDNWALCAASGLLGGRPRSDLQQDCQSIESGGLICFRERVPRWAIDYGDEGGRVILQLEVPASRVRSEERWLVIDRLISVSHVQKLIFLSRSDLDEYEATYDSFPDIPTTLFSAVVDSSVVEEGSTVPPDLGASSSLPAYDYALERDMQDAALGWSSELALLLCKGGHDELVQDQIRLSHNADKPPELIAQLAVSALITLDSAASSVDRAVLMGAARAVIQAKSSRGFEKNSLISAIVDSLPNDDPSSIGVRKWATVALDIVQANRDVPPLDDSGSVGQRAALACLLVPDAEKVEKLGLGSKVKVLSRLILSAFKGYSRLDANRFKSNREIVELTSLIGEALTEISRCSIHIGPRLLSANFEETDEVTANGRVLCQRRFSPPPHRLLLRARAEEIGLSLGINNSTKLLELSDQSSNPLGVYIDEALPDAGKKVIVRFWAPILPIKARTPGVADFKSSLRKAWDLGFGLAIRQCDGDDHLCAFVAQATNTLDQEEFLHHVKGLVHCVKVIRGDDRPKANKKPKIQKGSDGNS